MQFALNVLKFEDIREQIIQYLTNHSPYAGQFDFRSANLSYFIDTMAYVAMNMNFNLSHIANNRFLDTTGIRKNGVSRAREIGYTPKRPYSAKFRGKLIYKGANFGPENSLTIYPRSPFGGSFGNTYTNMEPIVLTYRGNPTQLEGDYTLSEGVFQYYKVLTTGQPNFSFTINNPNIDEEHFSLYVIPNTVADNPVNGLIDSPYQLGNFIHFKWNRVKTFKEMVDSNIYYLEEDIVNEGYPRIVFGNGLIGSVPLDTEAIYCECFQVKGAAANNENLISLPPMDTVAGTDQVFIYYGTGDMGAENKSKFSINNFDIGYQNAYNKSFGGSDLESLESIKASAPKYYSSVGRAATRNDYVYILKSFPGVGAVNVIGGPELYPDDLTQLGNIYASVVPNIDQTNFLYNNNIYMTAAQENDIRNKLNDYAIVSTQRHFYKPSYILIDVTPKIELTKNVTISEQNRIKTQVHNLITTYFNNTYNDLGIPFRESKVSVNIDGLDYISSSAVDLMFSFIINNNTVENLVEGVNNILYLPTKNKKDSSGNIIGTTNFIKTNAQVVMEDLHPGDWSILEKDFDDLVAANDVGGQLLYQSKLKLLNTYQNYLLPSQCSIYSEGGLINDTMTRNIYNRDFTTIKIADIWYAQGIDTMHSNVYNYQDKAKKTISVKINEDATGKTLVFSFEDALGISRPYPVANIIESNNQGIYDVDLQFDNDGEYRRNLYGYFGIDESQFIYRGYGEQPSPFNVIRLSATQFAIEMRINSFMSELVMTGENDLFDVLIDTGDVLISTPVDANNAMWNMLPQIKDQGGTPSPFAPITAVLDGNPVTVGYVEMSHVGLTNANNDKFRGFIGSEASQFPYLSIENTLLTTPGAYEVGDYFIITEFTYVPNASDPSKDVYYFPNDIVFVNEQKKLEKSKIKRTISSSRPEELNTTYNQGDLFYDAATSKYMVYDEIMPKYPLPPHTGEAKNYSYVVQKPYTTVDTTSFAVDPTQALPTALETNSIVEILLSDTINNGLKGSGISINYPSTLNDKIGTLLHRINDNGVDTWVDMGTTKVKDGDLIIYDGTDWRLLENTNRVVPSEYDANVQYSYDDVVVYDDVTYICLQTAFGRTPSTSPLYWIPYTDRVQVGAENITDGLLTGLSQGLYNIYRIQSVITVSTADDIAMFVNPPSDGVLALGDYIICVEPDMTLQTRGKWMVYNGDVFKYQIDAQNANSTFPVPLQVGDVFTVKVPGGVDPTQINLNFDGDTGGTSYLNDDQIMYIGPDDLGIPRWKKFTASGAALPAFNPDADALIGDLILIGDTDGNLGNDTTKLDVPQMVDPNDATVKLDMMFNYYDVLYYTGTHWIKAKPVNAYNVPNKPLLRQSLNTAGYNSDIMLKQTSANTFMVYMLDMYHNVVIGDLDYYTGRLKLRTSIPQTLNKLTTITGKASLSDVFKAENYLHTARQMDTIRMTPIRQTDSQSIDGNFDTNFNQYIVANVKDVQII